MILKLLEFFQTNLNISRRVFFDMIKNKQIILNGKTVESINQVCQENDNIKYFDTKWIQIQVKKDQKSSTNILLFNKPTGCVVSKSDPYNQTIYSILPKKFKDYYYIGRLDKDTHGLLLLTNNSKLVNNIQSPNFQIEKEYIVKVNKNFTDQHKEDILGTLQIDGEKYYTKNIQKISSNILRIILTSGKKRHIRIVLKYFGYQIKDLQRIRVGKYKLNDLKLGKYRFAK